MVWKPRFGTQTSGGLVVCSGGLVVQFPYDYIVKWWSGVLEAKIWYTNFSTQKKFLSRSKV